MLKCTPSAGSGHGTNTVRWPAERTTTEGNHMN